MCARSPVRRPMRRARVACSACSVDVTATQQAATVCGGSATVNGMDVAGPYDEVTDWAAAKAAGIDFAFIRVSDGLQYPDPWFDDYWPAAKAAGMLRGAYQFFRPDQDPIAQADFMLGKILPVTPGDLPPVLDLENAGDLTHEQVVASVQAYLRALNRITSTHRQEWRNDEAHAV